MSIDGTLTVSCERQNVDYGYRYEVRRDRDDSVFDDRASLSVNSARTKVTIRINEGMEEPTLEFKERLLDYLNDLGVEVTVTPDEIELNSSYSFDLK